MTKRVSKEKTSIDSETSKRKALERHSEVHRKRRVKALELSKELTPDPSKLLSPDGEMVLSDVSDRVVPEEGLRDPFAEKCDLLKTEWAFYGGELEPEIYLQTVKGYSKLQSKKIVEFEGIAGWREKRLHFQNIALENFTMRSVDTLVEFQDFCAKGSKLGAVRAMEMLQTPSKKVDPATGKWKMGLTSMDIKNCMDALDKAQTIVMRALGIHPKEEVGVKIIFEQLRNLQHQKESKGTFDESGREIPEVSGTSEDPRLQTLSHEEMWAMIEIVRASKNKE